MLRGWDSGPAVAVRAGGAETRRGWERRERQCRAGEGLSLPSVSQDENASFVPILQSV